MMLVDPFQVGAVSFITLMFVIAWFGIGKTEGLHTHHINGVKHDNSRRNLRVLCALCHKDVDEHHRAMHVKSDIERFIRLHREN